MSNGIQEDELASEEPGTNTITHLQNYINEKIDSLRAELQQSNDATSTQTVETGKTESELILYLSSEVDFLREELRKRSEEFERREASLQKVIEILDSENAPNRQAAYTLYSANLNAGGGSEWIAPKRTVRPLDGQNESTSIESANPFNVLSPNNDASEQSTESADAANPFRNVTVRADKPRRTKKKKAKNAENAANNQSTNVSRNANNANSSSDQVNAPPVNATRSRRREVIIIGDSMVKNLKGHLMSRKNCRITCVSISGMNMDEVTEVTRGLCARRPDVILVTCGTNSLFPKRTSGTETAPNPAELCAKMRSLITTIEHEFPKTKVILSKLIVRNDIDGASTQIDEVNNLISQSNLPHVDHSNINSTHLNGSKLHLNHSGDIQLAKNFVNFLDSFQD